MDIIVGFNSAKNNFADLMKTQLTDAGLEIDSLVVKSLKASVEEELTRRRASVNAVIIAENLESGSPYLVREVERLLSIGKDLKVILIVKDERRGSSYMSNLYANGVYTALYESDALMSRIADLIKNGRERQIAKAYYGITSPQINEGMSEVPKAEPSKAESSKPELYQVKPLKGKLFKVPPSEAGASKAEPPKMKPSKSEPSKVEPPKAEPSKVKPSKVESPKAESSVDDTVEMTEPVEERIPIASAPLAVENSVGANSQRIASNDIVAVYSSGNAKQAAYLAMDIARGIASMGGWTPAFVELPYGNSVAYDIFLDKESYMSPYHAVSTGDSWPDEKQIKDGVEIICPAPQDIIDNWDIVKSYRILHNASSPIVVTIGGEKALCEDARRILGDCKSLVVIVPEGSSAVAYAGELKQILNVSKDSRIITVSKNGDKKASERSDYLEVVFPEVFDEKYSGSIKSPLSEITKALGYGEVNIPSGVVGNFLRRNKGKKEKDRKKVSVPYTTEIVFRGAQAGAGCTYDVISCASALASRYSVAVLDAAERRTFKSLGGVNKCKPRVVNGLSMFTMAGADYYYDCDHSRFIDVFKDTYDFLIIDCGTSQVNHVRPDIVITALMGGEWNCDTMYEYLADEPSVGSKKSYYLISGYTTKELSEYRKMFGRTNIYGLPYQQNPKIVTEDRNAIFSRLCGGIQI